MCPPVDNAENVQMSSAGQCMKSDRVRRRAGLTDASPPPHRASLSTIENTRSVAPFAAYTYIFMSYNYSIFCIL